MGLILDRTAAEQQKDFSVGQGLLQDDGSRCFLCDGVLGGSEDQGYPIIYWWGSTGTVYWHASCAADFTFRIGQDVQTLKHTRRMHISFEPN
jgi:hypothetical protein